MRDLYVRRYQAPPSHQSSDIGDIFAVNPIRRSLAAIAVCLALIAGPVTFLDGDDQVAALIATSWFTFTGLIMCVPVLLISLVEEGWRQFQRLVWPTIDNLDLTPRAHSILRRHGFVTIASVERAPDALLLLLSNMDNQTLHDIRRSISLYRYRRWQENGFR